MTTEASPSEKKKKKKTKMEKKRRKATKSKSLNKKEARILKRKKKEKVEEAKKRKRNEKDEAKRGDGETGSGGGGTYENEDDDLLGDEEDAADAWAQYDLHPLLLKAIRKLRFTSPTPIQEKVLHPAIKGRMDIVGAAETGSGKTLAFGLPILQRLMQDKEEEKWYEEYADEEKPGKGRNICER